jgi:hypothetical protein
VSLAIQYRQRCNTSTSTTTTPLVALTPLKPSPSSLTLGSTTNVTPSSSSPNKDSTTGGPQSTIVHCDSNQSFHYALHRNEPSMQHMIPLVKNPVFGQQSQYGHVLQRAYLTPPTINGTMMNTTTQRSPATAVQDNEQSLHSMMQNRIPLSINNNTQDLNEAFTSRYEDSIHWASNRNNHTTGAAAAERSTAGNSMAPWSLPFLSHSMSTLPPFQSSIYLRQRNMNQFHGEHQGNNMTMGRNTMNRDDHLYVPIHENEGQVFPKQPYYTNSKDDENDDDDPIPISEIFHVSSNSWDQSRQWNLNGIPNPSRYDLGTTPHHRYTTMDQIDQAQPQQAPYLRRVSNFMDHPDDGNFRDIPSSYQASLISPSTKDISIMEHTIPGHTTIDVENMHHNYSGFDSLSTTGMTIETTDLKEFQNIIRDDTTDEGDNEEEDDGANGSSDLTSHHHSGGAGSDQHSLTGNASSTSSCCDSNSILHNDLCLSPLSISMPYQPQHSNHQSEYDMFTEQYDENHCNNEIGQNTMLWV